LEISLYYLLIYNTIGDNNFSDVAADVACKSVYGQGST